MYMYVEKHVYAFFGGEGRGVGILVPRGHDPFGQHQ